MLTDRLQQESFPSQPQEIAIANFGSWQIAVPTASVLVEKQIFSATVLIPERSYFSEGWAIYQEQNVAKLSGLEVRPSSPADSSFTAPLRLGPGIPLDFELQNHQPLPAKMTQAAKFACNYGETYFSVFRSIRPRFVRIYPFTSRLSLPHAVRQLLAAERAFVAEHRDRLQQVPFYCESFDLH